MGKQLKLFDSVSSGEKSSNLQPKLKSDWVKDLQTQVEYHQHLYYNAQPEISDAEFDKLWDELKTLDSKNEVFSKVGADFEASLGKVRHVIPMNELVSQIFIKILNKKKDKTNLVIFDPSFRHFKSYKW